MKKVFFALLAFVAFSVLFTACKKDKHEKENVIVTPKTPVPDAFVGKWSAGDFNVNEFHSYNGSSQPDATQMIAYIITKDGTAEQYVYYRFTDGSNKQTLMHRKGSVSYNEATGTLQFAPAEGTVRNFVGSTKTEGKVASDGLYPAYAPKYHDVSVEPYQQHLFLVGINDYNEQVEFLKGSW